MSDIPAVEIEGLWFSYDRRQLLRDVNLRIEAGERVCVVGPNGGGKTTLLKLMLGLLSPSGGSLRVLGDIPQRTRQRVGYVPQHAQFDPRFPVTVMDVVLMGRMGLGSGRGLVDKLLGRSDRRAAADALAGVGIYNLRNRSFSAISGGQRQRVLIARALAVGPELLLMDEPTANLDIGVEAEFYDLVQHLDEKMTLVMVTHDISFVSGTVGKVVCVSSGVEVHPTGELTGDVMRDLYGRDIRLVRHDHDCCEHGQEAGK